jgi:antitoxin ParD1/3/4
MENAMSNTTMNISLPEPLKEHVQKRVQKGDFSNASDYVRALIRADKEAEEKLAALRRDIAVGLAQLDRGEGRPADEVFERVKARGRARLAKR